ncbi:unnamed protein product [Discula destructiva]
MSSALRLGLSRPTAAVASHLLRPPPVHLHAASPSSSSSSSTPPSTAAVRTFSSTPAFLKIPTGNYRQGTPKDHETDPLPIPKPYAKDAHIPPYPYGPRTIYKQSNSGLYGNARIRFGNNVSEKHSVKTHRKWRPNVHRKALWSMALGCWVQTRMTMRVLKTIDKVGGLDNYLLGNKPMRIKELGPWGWKLRWRIMQSPVIRQQFRDERRTLGLPPTEQDLEDDLRRGIQQEDAEVAMQGEGSMEPNQSAEGRDPLTNEDLIAEIDGMIAAKEDFPLGEEGDVIVGPEVAKDEGFMKEQRP